MVRRGEIDPDSQIGTRTRRRKEAETECDNATGQGAAKGSQRAWDDGDEDETLLGAALWCPALPSARPLAENKPTVAAPTDLSPGAQGRAGADNNEFIGPLLIHCHQSTPTLAPFVLAVVLFVLTSKKRAGPSDRVTVASSHCPPASRLTSS